VLTCPICEAQYKAVATSDGNLRLEDFVVDENDFDELVFSKKKFEVTSNEV
jgi:hypothetical protein